MIVIGSSLQQEVDWVWTAFRWITIYEAVDVMGFAFSNGSGL